MEQYQLGRSDLQVTKLCLGSMTWGTQNTPAEAFAQLDTALASGVNFVDTAEMYPVNPISAATQGRSEEILGDWLAQPGKRESVVLATKLTGAGMRAIRDGAAISPTTIRAGLEGSLRRLKTDVVDLYQLHWPNRGSYHFRKNWRFAPGPSPQMQEEVAAISRCMSELVAEGKIRHYGLSNESAWGCAQWMQAELAPISIQNEYSLLCRTFDTDLGEFSVNESLPLLAYSPLATGLLTEKYTAQHIPAGSRRSINADLGGRVTPRVWPAIEAYAALARELELPLVHMALAFAMQRRFMGSVIFGATQPEQLALALGAAQVSLTPEALERIDALHAQHPMPY